jgi:hypothetical protein
VLRLSATLLESTRLYLAGVINADSLIDAVAGVQHETPQMALGSAFHAVFEHPERYYDLLEGLYVHSPEHCFDGPVFDNCVGDIWGLQPVIETKAEDLVLQTDHGPVRIVCMADALAGLECWELKTTENPLKPERYMDSMQWRAYVLAFGVNRVTYRLIKLKHLKDADVYTIDDQATISMYPYPQITQDVNAMANELTRFININKLEEHRQEAA